MVASGMGVGGAERIVVSLTEHLRQQGHEVAVAAPAGALDGELAATGVRRFVFAERGRSRAGAARNALAVARAVRAVRPDVVHAHNVKAAAIALAGVRLSGRRAPVIVTLHGIALSDDAAAARLLRRMERVACVAGELAERMAALGVPPGRLEVVPNAIEPQAPPSPAERDVLARELGVEGAPLVIAVGRLAPVKAHDRFLRAAATLAARRDDVRFLVVGDGPERGALESLARELGLADRVRFTGTRTDARALIACAALVVFTSESEGLSLAALEALDAGVPVVAPAVAGMRELLGGGAGVLIADTGPDAVAEAADALLGDDARRRAMGEAGRALVREGYASARMYAAYDALYAAATAG
jgi:glycosyltransferase involved in cell wall biosynthesis